MNAIFNQRVDTQLEFIKYLDFPYFPEPGTCSLETLEAWYDLFDDYVDAGFLGIELCNKETFLKEVAEYIREDLGAEPEPCRFFCGR